MMTAMNFSSVYACFENIFQTLVKENEERTVGDALLAFMEIYGYKAMTEMTASEMQMRIARSVKVFETQGKEESLEIRMNPESIKKPLLQRLIPVSEPVQKIAFVHEVDPHRSAWTYIHDLGRMYLENAFSDQIKISTYLAGEILISRGCSTSGGERWKYHYFYHTPVLYNASLKAALDHPGVKILNCSLMSDKGVIRNYNARIYEAKFLLGAIAGAMTTNDRARISGRLSDLWNGSQYQCLCTRCCR